MQGRKVNTNRLVSQASEFIPLIPAVPSGNAWICKIPLYCWDMIKHGALVSVCVCACFNVSCLVLCVSRSLISFFHAAVLPLTFGAASSNHRARVSVKSRLSALFMTNRSAVPGARYCTAKEGGGVIFIDVSGADLHSCSRQSDIFYRERGLNFGFRKKIFKQLEPTLKHLVLKHLHIFLLICKEVCMICIICANRHAPFLLSPLKKKLAMTVSRLVYG